MAAYTFDPTILREYDIRGIVGKTLNPSDAKAVGQAYGTMIVRRGGTSVAVGYDGRHSSPTMEAAMVEGLASTGLKVHRIGLGPTPMLYYAIVHLETAAGVMITGSHNPPDYNGIKMAWSDGPVYGDAIQEIGRIAAADDFATGEGSDETVDITEAYVDRLLEDYQGPTDLTVVWDAGNGATGDMLQRLVAKLPGTHHLLFEDIDGDFPNHHPDPTIAANLVDLQAKVAETGADMGIGFDGDGDRIGAIDEQGRIIWGDQLIAIYASEVLAEHPGGTIIADVKASQVLYDRISALGGTPLMWKTGHSLLKAKMKETGSPLAGEMSGHIFFNDKFYGYDDALYCGVRLLSLVSKAGVKLSSLKDQLPDMLNTPEVRFTVDEPRKFAIVEEVKERLAAAGADVNGIDGVRVNTADGWWLCRASNTQDVLVVRAESETEEGLERLKDQIVAQLKESGVDVPSFEQSAGH